jgi:hypothetical protein
MDQIANISFVDLESQDEGHAIVRATPNQVALCLTLRTDGDLEVVMPAEVARQLSEALSEAAGFSKPSWRA